MKLQSFSKLTLALGLMLSSTYVNSAYAKATFRYDYTDEIPKEGFYKIQIAVSAGNFPITFVSGSFINNNNKDPKKINAATLIATDIGFLHEVKLFGKKDIICTIEFRERFLSGDYTIEYLFDSDGKELESCKVTENFSKKK